VRRNIVDYLETIWRVLKPGGSTPPSHSSLCRLCRGPARLADPRDCFTVIIWLLVPAWINLGPTLWHFENTAGASSIELTLEDLKALATRIGFVIKVG
jgi:carnosine N-methyltransferase